MKILYAVQGTGNGHIARALDIYPALTEFGDVDILLSGIQGDIQLPFPVKYRLGGLSFIFGKHGGVDKWATVKKMKLVKLIRDIYTLPVHNYDLIINDFEVVSAWACKLRKKNCISLSHQSAVLHPDTPKPQQKDFFGDWILKYYAPTNSFFGFHFKAFDKNIFTPIIRKQVRELKVSDEGHYTVYLPSYDDNTLVKELSAFETIKWQVFSKHCKEAFDFKNIQVKPIENDAFVRSMASSKGILCGAGFETPAETLFLGKKLLSIPMHGQYEQQCNAAFLASMGIPVIDALSKKNRAIIAEWLDNDKHIKVNYPDNTKQVVTQVVEAYWATQKGN
ncbi:MAG: glycosyltransferase family protein [Bacteroidota bacterium]